MRFQKQTMAVSPGYFFFIVLAILCLNSGCSNILPSKNVAPETVANVATEYDYVIGPGDRLNIFVWKNPDISVPSIPVRPDGRISSPLVEDMLAAGKTPTQLADDIEQVLNEYIKRPLVTVTVIEFFGEYDQQIRVVGEAAIPRALSYRKNMTLLDVMIAVGGLTEFAAGNKSSIVRKQGGEQKQINVRLEDLLRGGDISANVGMMPGDIIIIPESLF